MEKKEGIASPKFKHSSPGLAADTGVPMEGHTNIHSEIGSKKRCQKPSNTEPNSSLKSKKSKDDNYITAVASKDPQTIDRATRSKTHKAEAGAVDPPVVHGGYYVVNNFDSDAMVLRLPRGDIPITREIVHHLLGLPLGETSIESLQFRENDDDTLALWKEQFQGSSDIKPKGIQKAMLNTTEPNLIFKVNLFVLLCTSL
ncbi:hypothetical protein L1887_35014 [Cichorium endivia]|nr:hypothetical protein L1887_35014 [Cichorium endivia]